MGGEKFESLLNESCWLLSGEVGLVKLWLELGGSDISGSAELPAEA